MRRALALAATLALLGCRDFESALRLVWDTADVVCATRGSESREVFIDSQRLYIQCAGGFGFWGDLDDIGGITGDSTDDIEVPALAPLYNADADPIPAADWLPITEPLRDALSRCEGWCEGDAVESFRWERGALLECDCADGVAL